MKKIALILMALSLTYYVNAQDATLFNFTFNHLALSVKDINRSADFYKEILNLTEITNRTKVEGIKWFSLNDGKELHLISIIQEDVIINKAVHVALTTSHFESFVKKLEREKILYSDWAGTPNKINIRPDGIQQIFFQDPDGYWIEVNSVGQNLSSNISAQYASGIQPAMDQSLIPAVHINHKREGSISKEDLLNSSKLSVNAPYDTIFRIASFRLTRIRKGEAPVEVSNETGGEFTDSMKGVILNSVTGDKLYFEYIKCRDHDGKLISLGALSFIIK